MRTLWFRDTILGFLFQCVPPIWRYKLKSVASWMNSRGNPCWGENRRKIVRKKELKNVKRGYVWFHISRFFVASGLAIAVEQNLRHPYLEFFTYLLRIFLSLFLSPCLDKIAKIHASECIFRDRASAARYTELYRVISPLYPEYAPSLTVTRTLSQGTKKSEREGERGAREKGEKKVPQKYVRRPPLIRYWE